MEWVETTGRTVEEAKDAALDQLGVDEHDAEFEIVEEPKVGLFGRLRNEARVRARVRPTTPRPKEERRGRRKRSDGRRGGGRTASTGEATSTSGGETGAAGDESQDQARPPKEKRPARPPARAKDTGRQSESGERSVDVPLQEQADVARQFLVGLTREF